MQLFVFISQNQYTTMRIDLTNDFIETQRRLAAGTVIDLTQNYEVIDITNTDDFIQTQHRLPTGTVIDLTQNYEVIDMTNTDDYPEGSSEREDDVCAICFAENILTPVSCPCCEHCFCKVCLSCWLTKAASCPICRTPLQVSGLVVPSAS